MITPSHAERLSGFSVRLEEFLAEALAGRRGTVLLAPELADEIAATAGEIMVELASYRSEELVREVIEGARRLREVVRTLRPEAVLVEEAGRALVDDLTLVIRDERRAA
jgi:hypothetical protein